MNLKIIYSLLFLYFLSNTETFAAENIEVDVRTFEEFQPLLSPSDDKIYVFNFWATWCRPCIKELPYFEELNKNYKNKNVKVYLVSLDFIDHLESHLLPFLNRNPLESELILLNAPRYNQWIHKVSDEWSGAIPATIFLYDKGNSQKFYQQEFTYSELENIIKSIQTN
jgi:thiol-disulfide isomerase/thioredoxin